MNRSRFLRAALAGCAFVVLPSVAATPSDKSKRKPDLGDAAEGTYFGDVISDSKGSSKSDVTLTVTRIGLNRVRVTSDYPRLPVVEVSLTRAMDKILNQGGDTTFLLDRAKGEGRLDVSFLQEVSWSGTKQK
jgi:hypothetical protein